MWNSGIPHTFEVYGRHQSKPTKSYKYPQGWTCSCSVEQQLQSPSHNAGLQPTYSKFSLQTLFLVPDRPSQPKSKHLCLLWSNSCLHSMPEVKVSWGPCGRVFRLQEEGSWPEVFRRFHWLPSLIRSTCCAFSLLRKSWLLFSGSRRSDLFSHIS